MINSDNDPVLERAISELKQLPSVDREAMRRVIEAAATARVTPADEPILIDERSNGARRARIWSLAALAAAAGIIGFVVRGAWRPTTSDIRPAVASVRAATALQPVADDGGAKPLLQQFVFANAKASRVSVVGDFNQWNAASAPMTRSADGELWSVLIPILPGRHVFAFMVDDSVLTLDPDRPTARDPDLGTDASVVMVRRQ